jgi:hypothetical protein
MAAQESTMCHLVLVFSAPSWTSKKLSRGITGRMTRGITGKMTRGRSYNDVADSYRQVYRLEVSMWHSYVQLTG